MFYTHAGVTRIAHTWFKILGAVLFCHKCRKGATEGLKKLDVY
jgi:hypothetical protein